MIHSLKVKLFLRIQRWSIVKPPLRRWLLNAAGARLHPTAIVEHGCWLTHKVEMGAGTILNCFAFVDGSDWLVIEAGVRIAIRATIITRTHGIGTDPTRRSDHDQDVIAPVRVGQGSWVGAGCTILPGVTIAPGCVIGAGAVVNRSTQPDGLYGGIPARRIKNLP